MTYLLQCILNNTTNCWATRKDVGGTQAALGIVLSGVKLKFFFFTKFKL